MSAAAGSHGADVVGIGLVSLANVQFGVADDINSTTGPPIGLLGLGYDVNEAVPLNETYPNLVDTMLHARVIESRLYSVSLGRQCIDSIHPPQPRSC